MNQDRNAGSTCTANHTFPPQQVYVGTRIPGRHLQAPRPSTLSGSELVPHSDSSELRDVSTSLDRSTAVPMEEQSILLRSCDLTNAGTPEAPPAFYRHIIERRSPSGHVNRPNRFGPEREALRLIRGISDSSASLGAKGIIHPQAFGLSSLQSSLSQLWNSVLNFPLILPHPISLARKKSRRGKQITPKIRDRH
jgi:hypothetical protein